MCENNIADFGASVFVELCRGKLSLTHATSTCNVYRRVSIT